MAIGATSITLDQEIGWLARVVTTAIEAEFSDPPSNEWVDISSAPDFATDNSIYATMVRNASLSEAERLILALAMAPEISPSTLDPFMITNQAINRGFTEFGGQISSSGGFQPTIQTALFVLSGGSMKRRIEAMNLFLPSASLIASGFLDIKDNAEQRQIETALRINRKTIQQLKGLPPLPKETSENFPAKTLTSKLGWEDLVLPDDTRYEVEEILCWMKHGRTLLSDPYIGPRLKPGFRSLFFGPPGTGKTLTAALLGNRTGRDVYRIDLSMVVSKWIGETEKNLAEVFDTAEGEDWILFFDEADALFGKRTDVTHANDRHANQEVSYILQRIEDFNGVIILASNLKGNMDVAFTRRFQSVIEFTPPGPDERLELWSNAFGGRTYLTDDVDLRTLADSFELTGGEICNVLQFCLLDMFREGHKRLTFDDIAQGVARESRKNGKYEEVLL